MRQQRRSLPLAKIRGVACSATKQLANAENAADSLAVLKNDLFRSASKNEAEVGANHIIRRSTSRTSSNADDSGSDVYRAASNSTVTTRPSFKTSIFRVKSQQAALRKQSQAAPFSRHSKELLKVTHQPRALTPVGVRRGVPHQTCSNFKTPREAAMVDRSGDHSLDVDAPLPLRTDIVKLSKELCIPLDILKEAADLFRAQLPPQSKLHDPLAQGQLTRARLKDLFGSPHEEDDEQVSVGFGHFALLFYCQGFSEGLTLTEEQRNLRQVARKHNIPITDLDEYKLCFDRFDADGNQTIDGEEFEAMIHQLNKVPEGQTLPPGRIAKLFTEADTDHDGLLNFEEFICFYHQYFRSQAGCPFSRFYFQARSMRQASR